MPSIKLLCAMRASRTEIIEQNLKVDEYNLLVLLNKFLPEVEIKGNNIFFNSEYGSDIFPIREHHKESEKLLMLAKRIIFAEKELGRENDKSIGNAFLSICEENSSNNEHRRGPKKLAKHLNEFIEKHT